MEHPSTLSVIGAHICAVLAAGVTASAPGRHLARSGREAAHRSGEPARISAPTALQPEADSLAGGFSGLLEGEITNAPRDQQPERDGWRSVCTYAATPPKLLKPPETDFIGPLLGFTRASPTQLRDVAAIERRSPYVCDRRAPNLARRSRAEANGRDDPGPARRYIPAGRSDNRAQPGQSERNGAADTIARSGPFIRWRPEQLAFTLLDVDTKGMPAAVREQNVGANWAALVSALPPLNGAGRLAAAARLPGSAARTRAPPRGRRPMVRRKAEP